jgi:hypothetical protein
MAWDEVSVRKQVRNELIKTFCGIEICTKIWVLPYLTRRSGNADGVSEFIWAYKDGRGTAPATARKLLAEAVAKYQQVLSHTLGCSVICCAPSSQAGPPSETAENVCNDLARQFQWLTHYPGLLHRTRTITPAHRCRPGERPTTQTHLESIAYRGNYNLDGKQVLLFDDLLTKSDTFDACTQILMFSAKCRGVAGLFLGKTQ